MTQLLLPLLVFLLGTVEERPRHYESIVYAVYPADYYTEQARRWAEVAADECATESDYLEYYLAARYANRYAGGDYQLEGIVQRAAAELDTAGFTVNYLRYVQQAEGVRYDHLRAAYRADRDNRYVQSSMLGAAVIGGETELASVLSQRVDEIAPYPAGLTDYNYNTLTSVARNGLLVTFGDADTYPAWVLQHAHGVRPDVLVVNYYLLRQSDEYADRIFSAAGVSQSPASQADTRLAQLRLSERPLHLAATVGDRVEDLGVSRDDLYAVGLVFRVSDTPVENLSTTRRLYRDVWRLDHVRRPLSNSPQSRVGEQFSPNYLLPLIDLLRQQSDAGLPDPELRELIDGIAQRSQLTERVATLLGESADATPQLASNTPGMETKLLLVRYRNGDVGTRTKNHQRKELMPFGMQDYETTNAEYELFLQDLLRQRKFDYLDTAATGRIDWKVLLPDSIAGLPDEELFANGRPEDGNHPVVNISHRAAELYAIWLTQVYNQDPKRRDTREVRFRLPTAQEFELAARGGKLKAAYPWGGPYYYNKAGCILANLNAALLGDSYPAGSFVGIKKGGSRKRSDPGCKLDGGYVTTPVWHYYPNGYGLYNMAGNAAEMTDIDGQTMGGSWLDGPEALRNGVVTERQLPSPTTGFRLVLEYVD